MNIFQRDEAKRKVEILVDHFSSEIGILKSESDVYEATVEDNFVKPLFQYLNWNIHNEGLKHGREEFIVQYHLKRIGKKPDYLLRVPDQSTGRMKHILFMEAKHPKYDLFNDIRWIRQCYLYANSTQCKAEREDRRVPLSILTDFEEFRLFDCRDSEILKLNTLAHFNKRAVKPFDNWNFHQYITQFDLLWDTFEFSNVCKGSLDQYRVTDQSLRDSRKAPDLEFLDVLKAWRIELAKDMYKKNHELSADVLTAASQLMVNRFVFLKMLSDKDLSDDYLTKILDTVKSTGKNDVSLYDTCKGIFTELHKSYNGSIFEYRIELDSVAISNKTIENILDSLRPEKAIYSLDAMPVRVVGTMYEEFLGETIQKSGKTIEAEPKAELRKSGGVYYTPEYIVDYIVDNTVGVILSKCKKPSDVLKLKICDPACGSGSFLIAVYDRILQWFTKYYNKLLSNNIKKGEKLYELKKKYIDDIHIEETKENVSLSLTIKLKSRILTSCIFGVDLDSQAVEVAKFSLCMKTVEDYFDINELKKEITLFNTTVLPDLSRNIKHGNSLISEDYKYESEADIEKKLREKADIRPFSWEKEFPNVFSENGFDIIVGNPPYRREKDFKELLDPIMRSSLGRKYKSARMDLWYYFVHRGIEILKPNGLLSFITNAYFLNSSGSEKLIEHIKKETAIREIFYFSDLKIFENVSGKHLIFNIIKSDTEIETKIKYVNGQNNNADECIENTSFYSEYTKRSEDLYVGSKIDIERQILSNGASFFQNTTQLGAIGFTRQGIAENPSSINNKTNKKFGNIWTVGEGVFSLTIDELKELKLSKEEKKLIRPYYDLCDISRYYLAPKPSHHLIYSTRTTCPDINEYPIIKAHLQRFKQIMELRRETQNRSNDWWNLHWPRDEKIWKMPKILSVQMSKRPVFMYSYSAVYVPFSINVFIPEKTVPLEYYAAVLNSKLLWYWFIHNAKKRGVGLEINGNVLEKAPIRFPEEVGVFDDIKKLVNDLVILYLKEKVENSQTQKNGILEEIQNKEIELDNLIFDIYNIEQNNRENIITECNTF